MVHIHETIPQRKKRLYDEILQSLTECVQFHKCNSNVEVMLFGSFATGRFDALSDVDLAVIAETEKDMDGAHELAARLLRWRPPHVQGVDVVVLPRARLPSSGLADAISSGIAIRREHATNGEI